MAFGGGNMIGFAFSSSFPFSSSFQRSTKDLAIPSSFQRSRINFPFSEEKHERKQIIPASFRASLSDVRILAKEAGNFPL